MTLRLRIIPVAAMLLLFGVLVAACSSDSKDVGTGGDGADATQPADDDDTGDAGTGGDGNDATQPADDGDTGDAGTGGDGTDATQPADDGDTGDAGTGGDGADGDDEERIAAAVSNSYGYVSDGNYDAVWSGYTSAFQKTCSFDDFVNFVEQFRRTEGWDELLPTQIEVDVLDDRAVANLVIQTSSDGHFISEYDYSVIYVYEGGEWRAEETCY